MWTSIGKAILRFRYPLIILLLAITAFLGWQASQVKLSYEFTRAIPTDNPKYLIYQAFRQKFGDDGNLLVIGIRTRKLFDEKIFNDYLKLQRDLKKTHGVVDVVSVPSSISLVRDEETERLRALPIFPDTLLTKAQIDSSAAVFLNLPFYRGLLYNPETGAWLMGVSVDPKIMNSPERTGVVEEITRRAESFGLKNGVETHLSGLPLIRTVVSDRIKAEMGYFLLGSVLLSLVILLLFFRSWSATALSMGVVIIGVVWS
ncbi:MAG TPA: MMPL family transporter, partial [Flavisolibacter sp.]